MGQTKDHTFLLRHCVLNERDELAFCRALRERFPSIVFMDWRENESPDIPLSSCYPAEAWTEVWALIPDDVDWKPFCVPAEFGSLILNLPRHRFLIRRSFWEWPLPRHWAGDPPFLMMGGLEQPIRKQGDEELRTIVQDAFRCLAKVTRRIHAKCFGYDALRWASEAPRRVLDGGFVPPADYKFPVNNRYYNDALWGDRLPDQPTLQTRGRPYDVEAFKRGEPV